MLSYIIVSNNLKNREEQVIQAPIALVIYKCELHVNHNINNYLLSFHQNFWSPVAGPAPPRQRF